MVRVFRLVGPVLAAMAASPLNAQTIWEPKGSRFSDVDWSGWYVGAHFGTTAATSDWTVGPAEAAAAAAGRTNLTHGLDVFKGSGSFAGGLHGGYIIVGPSRIFLGIEADASFPNSVSGTGVAPGIASYRDTVLHLGSVRGRAGYMLGNDWLIYGTGGFAWSYDQLTRTDVGGIAVPAGTDESRLLWRFGWTAGAGIELPVASDWSARLEYLYSGFDDRSKTFPGTPEAFNSDLALHQIRFGLNYKLSADAPRNDGRPVIEPFATFKDDIWSVHGQTTFVEQYAASFRAPYRGPNSLRPNEGRETFDATAYLGLRPWQGAEIWINPEIDQGFGLSGTLGAAGFPSGEAYKKGADYPYTRLHRAFIRQTIDLGGEPQTREPAINQFAARQTADRLVLTTGKFSVGDIFDTNKYAHDPRSDFLNCRSSTPAPSTTPPRLGATRSVGRRNGIKLHGRCAVGCSICRSRPTALTSIRASDNFSGSAKSNIATTYLGSPASSR